MNSPLISFVTASYPRFPGGGVKVVYEQANRLAADGFRVRVVHSLGFRPGLTGAADRGVDLLREIRSGHVRRRIRWIEPSPGVDVVVLGRLEQLAGLTPPDLWVTTYWSTNLAVERWGAGRPCLQFMQAYESWATTDEQIAAVWLMPLHKAVVSRSLMRRGQSLGVPVDLMHLVPNGLDTSLYRPATDLSDRPPQLAFLAHSAPVKGMRDAIAVSEIVHQRRPDVPFCAFGWEPRPRGLPSFVSYVRGATEGTLVKEVYSRSSVFLCSSISEGWGYPSMEAMACGSALVSTRNGGVDEFAVDGESALLAPVGDVGRLAEHVVALLSDSAQRIALAQAGMASVRRFTWEASSIALQRAIGAALERS